MSQQQRTEVERLLSASLAEAIVTIEEVKKALDTHRKHGGDPQSCLRTITALIGDGRVHASIGPEIAA